jgi:hypothetical protein
MSALKRPYRFCLFHYQLQTVQLDDILSAGLKDRQRQNRYQQNSVKRHMT